ncbi:MAG: hypothetical protein A3J74_01980 [Elusimicrobia bacterium RIFCSPHIGHO2_02_FULL_57_9]|nr:MAG: hypothetical protein A3J74_01980 [Elusimicrobia bacterium RIFCSPHIGHO2_02_FULL_57_9]
MIKLTVNGKKRAFCGPPFKRLIDVLREDFRLTGAKEGCGEGECGACAVLVEGQAVNSCLIPVCQMDGRKIETIEALGTVQKLHPLQEAFIEEGGAQCGICTPGMLMTACAWLRSHRAPKHSLRAHGARPLLKYGRGTYRSPQDIRRVLAGNLCRCTGYQPIVNSVVRAMKRHRTPK